jgi:hypothetical protein
MTGGGGPSQSSPAASTANIPPYLRPNTPDVQPPSTQDLANLPQTHTSVATTLLPTTTTALRPVDKSRGISTFNDPVSGQRIQWERYTPEEIQDREVQRQVSLQGAVEMAKMRIANQAAAANRQDTLQREGGVVAQGLSSVGIPDGTVLTRAENLQYNEAAQKLRAGNRLTLKEGESVFDTTPGAGGTTPGLGAPIFSVPPKQTPEEDALDKYARDHFVKPDGTPMTSRKDMNALQDAAARNYFKATGTPEKETEDNLAWLAEHSPDPAIRAQAERAIQRIVHSKIAARPVTTNIFTPPANASGKASINDVPAEYRDQVQQVLNYEKPLPPMGRNNPTNQAINYWVSRVGAADPATGRGAYNAGEFPARSAYMRSLSGTGAGTVGSQIIANNTMIAHAEKLWDSADKLNNSTFRKYNTFANFLKSEAGSDFAKPFQIARLGVAEELGKLLKGGVATKEEVDHWLQLIDSSDSPAALKTSVRTILEMAHGRIQALEDNHERVMGVAPPNSFVSPRAQKVVDRIMGTGGQGAGATGGNPYGNPYK